MDAWGYNSSLQVSGISSANGFGLGYTYFADQNVETQTIYRPGKTWSQAYTYDNVNRLKTAAETGQANDWSQTYDYTATRNRYVSASLNFTPGTFTATSSSQFDGGNHLVMSGVSHDNAGNQTQMGSGLTMAYDADGRMQSSTLNGLTTYYVYDADGHRVMKTAGSASTTYVYDAFGQLAMEVGGTGAPPCATCFLTVDALGSTREVTDAATGGTVSNYDYLPFGEELTGVAGRTGAGWGVNDAITLKLTGKERDTDTAGSGNAAGLDYFGARYYSGGQGRFTSPDEPFIDQDPSNPQSWNLYSYGRNNPLRYNDPSGRCSKASGGYTDEGEDLFPGPCANGTIGEDKPQTVNALDISQRGGDLFVNGQIVAEGGLEHDYAADLGFLGLIRGAFGGLLGGAVAESAGPALFDLAPIARGNAVERALGANLPRTFPTFDKFINGVASSIKSIDLRAVTYQNPANLERVLTNYVDKVANFTSGAVGRTAIEGSQISGRVLEVAVPQGGASAAQQAVLSRVTAAAAQRGVQVVVIPIR
jgi:RHS repeat-associated protein